MQTITSPPLNFNLKITVIELNEDCCSISASQSFSIPEKEIFYRAEGNANLVLSIPHRRQVLRLPKSDKKILNGDFKSNAVGITNKISLGSNCEQSPYKQHDIFCVCKYIKSVAKLFGANVSQPPVLVRTEFSNVHAFYQWLQCLRPKERIFERDMKFNFSYGLLYPDAAVLHPHLDGISDASTFSVEIKPKQGWSPYQLPENLLELFRMDALPFKKCRFCSMQYLKLKESMISKIGKYCPLDLFSGDFHRMSNAIYHLIESPQNNFRIFKNGSLIYSTENYGTNISSVIRDIFETGIDDNEILLKLFVKLLIKLLLFDLKNGIEQQNESINTSFVHENGDTTLESCCDTDANALPNNCLLKSILNLQHLAKETLPVIALNFENGIQLTSNATAYANIEWPINHIINLHNKLADFNPQQETNITSDYLKTVHQLDSGELYDIGATALDSSVMLTFQNVTNSMANAQNGAINNTNRELNYGQIHDIEIDNNKFLFNATVFDLDPKLYPRHYLKFKRRTIESYDKYRTFLRKQN